MSTKTGQLHIGHGRFILTMRVMAVFAAITVLSLTPACKEDLGGRVDVGSLTIRIVTPSTEDSFLSTTPNVPFGGQVGGWSFIDEAPVIHWANEATGASGSIGQLLGTWSAGRVNLQPGVNRLRVHAENGVQDDASDEITVTYQP